MAAELSGPRPATSAPHKLLSVRDVADWLQLPVKTLYRWRYLGEGPPSLKVGKHLRYRPADVEAWLETRG